jgi:hypothetical protein
VRPALVAERRFSCHGDEKIFADKNQLDDVRFDAVAMRLGLTTSLLSGISSRACGPCRIAPAAPGKLQSERCALQRRAFKRRASAAPR